MRVLIISDYRDTRAAKPEAALMLGLREKGVDLDIITYPDTEYHEDFRRAGITVIDDHPSRKIDRAFIARLKSLTKERGYQIFYLFNSQAIINGLIAAYSLPVKVVLYRGYTGNIHWYDPAAYLKYLNPRVDRVVGIAESIRELLHRQWTFRKHKAVTIRKGHDPAWYQGVPAADLSIFAVPQDAFVIACMANQRKFKGIKYLLQATYEMVDLENLHLLLIGRDMDAGELKRLIQESPIKDRIHLTGWRDDVLSILASCDAFVLPSIGGEAITKSLIEAMSMGLAPVITNIAGNRDLVIHKENGLVVPVRNPKAIANAVKELYKNPELTAKLGKAAKDHIRENFDSRDTVENTFKMFTELIKV